MMIKDWLVHLLSTVGFILLSLAIANANVPTDSALFFQFVVTPLLALLIGLVFFFVDNKAVRYLHDHQGAS